MSFLTVKQAAERIGISKKGVAYHIKKGRLSTFQIIDGIDLIRSAAVEEFIQLRSKGPIGPIGRPRKRSL
jgi:hypothetical protein